MGKNTANPAAALAALRQAVDLHRQGRLAEAEALYQGILRLYPWHVEALHLLGVAALQAGRVRQGVELVGQAVALAPRHAEAHSNLGNGLLALGRPDQALAHYAQALALKPGQPEALNNLGNALRALGRPAEALARYDQALALRPGYAEALNNRGLVLQDLKRLEEALACHEQVLALKPGDIDALNNRGVALRGLKRPEEALASYDQALRLKPDYVEALSNRGLARQDLGLAEEALASYSEALRLKPDYAEALHNRGNALQALGRFEEALADYRQALRLKPDYAEAHYNFGIALQGLRRYEEALAAYGQALRFRPDYAEALNNRGAALRELKRTEEALDSYRQALRLRPDYAQAHWNAGLAWLVLGDYGRGFREYEWRWETVGFTSKKRDFPQPLWLGQESLQGKTLLLYAEQGLGDTLQFCRYAKQAAALGATVLLEVQPPLKSLLAGLEGVSQVFGRGEPLPAFDCHCPLLSLPLAFQTRLDSVPAGTPYLQADPARVAFWQARLGAKAQARIGLVWSGSTEHRNDHNRSIPLAEFAALAAPGRAQWVSLQKQVREADLPALQARPDIARLGEDLADFADTAALVACLDLVIAVDTSVAHLAGALGKPVWLLLPFNPDWRWLLEREDSPWYPAMRLFRQPSLGDWAGVIARIGQALAPDLSALWPRALELHRQGRLAEAQTLYRQILGHDPGHFDALHMLGVATLQAGETRQGVALIGQALALEPNHADAHSNLGNGWLDLGHPEEALACYERALALNPGHADALGNRGNALLRLNRPAEALASYEQSLRLRPGHAETLANRGNALLDLDRPEEALVCYGQALALRPNHLEALNSRGIALRKLKRPQEALACYEQALALKPDYVEALSNAGLALQDLKRPQEALDCYAKALALKPDYAEAFYNQGNALQDLGRHRDTLSSYQQALRLKPDYAEVHWNASLSRLVQGDFERGFEEYEWRWKKNPPSPSQRNFPQPTWLGQESLQGKTILLYSEQGLGDTLQFCRYAKQAAALGATVLLEVQPPLKSLLAGLEGVSQVFGRGEPLPAFDCHCPLLSLPLAFKTRLDTIPADIPYLSADPARIDAWQARLGAKTQARIGLVWSGNPEHRNDHNRSIPLAEFAALAAPGRAQWVSLQKQVREADLPALQARPDIARLGEELGDFADTAALVACLDLVIAVDTSVAHLAGALGKPVWLLLPFNPDWRWLLEREDSPWYPAMRLFRQPSLGDWAGVIARIAQALAPDLSALWPQALDLHQQGRLAEAQALYREVLRHAPGHFDALHMLGVATLQAGETRQGIALIGQALALEPNHADAHSNLGNGWLDLGRPEEALACYERALALNPDHADALNNRGNALQALKRPAEALASYEQALRLKPAQADTLANCGNALLDLDRPGDALACYDQALALNPGHADALINRGNALQGLTRHGEALDSYARALALRPDYAEAHWNEGLSRLVLGDFERGWAKYEWRWKKKTTVSPLRDFAQPLWLGRESLQGKTVLLHAEQGHGDTIQFCRYARHVAARGAAVLLEVQAGLKPLLAGLEGVGRVLAKGEALPDFDCHCPLLSLPLAFGTRLETIPADIPYLSADPARAALWQARLGPKTRPRVGLAWSGNSAHVNDRNRSVPLAEFARRLGGQAQWVSLQKQVREGDWEALQARRDIAHYGEALGDFADTAALLVNLDLVIAVDTAVAHLAGALGKPVWLLLPFNPDWRWLLGREDSPWYPSLRLFRQSAPGDWDGVLARVADALGRFAP